LIFMESKSTGVTSTVTVAGEMTIGLCGRAQVATMQTQSF
jgi:hypothetical protein